MRGVLLWLRTKRNQPVSPISEPSTGLCVGELDRPYHASKRSEQGLSPPCVVIQVLHVFWHSKLKSLLPCTTNFPNGLDSALHANLLKPAIK